MGDPERPVLRHGWRRRPPRLASVDAVDLGVHAGDHGTPGYVPRAVDAALDRLVEDHHPLVLACGPRLAGTSRALVHAARRRVADHRLVRFPETVRGDLHRLLTQAGRWVGRSYGVVLWLDDAHLALLSQIDRELLTTAPPGVTVLATTRQAVLDSGALPGHAVEALDGRRVAVDPGDVEDGVPPRSHVTRALSRARSQLAPGPRRAPRVALLRAAVDWDRHQVPYPLDRSTLRQLALLYCHDLEPTRLEGREAALDALLDDVGRGWLTVSVRDGAPHYRPHALLTAAAEDPDLTWTTSEAVWRVYGELPASALRATELMSATGSGT